jgi:activator of HSP90 ATPase
MEFTIQTKLAASPSEIYKAWLSSDGHTKMTGSAATASEKVGDKYSAWDGYISGKTISLRPHSIIKQSWRTTEFKDSDKDTVVEIQIRGNKKESTLTIIHTELPEDGEKYKKGWEEHYFAPMKEFFSK